MISNSNKTILIIDDDSDVREVAKIALSQSDYTFLEAANGQEGLDVLEKNRIDLVLMDVIMPIMDGFDSCKVIKKQAKYKDLPIIMLTSLCDVDSISYAFTSGATDFISKPIVIPLLVQRVSLSLQSSEKTESGKNQKNNALSWKYHIESKAMTISKELRDTLGIDRQKEYSLSSFLSLVDESYVSSFKSQIKYTLEQRSSSEIKIEIVTKTNEQLKVQQKLSLVKMGGKGYFLIGEIDVEEKCQSQGSDYFKYNDQVTELPNQVSLEKRLKYSTLDNKSVSTVFFVSVDKLSEINRDLGQAAGNKALKYVADIINDVCAEKFSIYRYHGNGFVMIVKESQKKKWARDLAQRIQKSVYSSSVFVEKNDMKLTVSVGVEYDAMLIMTLDKMIGHADTAARHAHNLEGDIVCFYDKDMEDYINAPKARKKSKSSGKNNLDHSHANAQANSLKNADNSRKFVKLLKVLPVILVLGIAGFIYSNDSDFNLPDLNGKVHKLSDYRGKWVVVNYWATWCPSCIEEIPELTDFHDKHSETDALVLGINFENNDISKVREFLVDYTVSFPVLMSKSAPKSELGKIPGLPTTFIVAPNGEVVHRKVGAVDIEYLEKIIATYQ